MKVKNVKEYPFIELVYELIDKVGFIITEEAINADTNFYETIEKLYGKEAVFNLEKLIYILKKEHQKSGFLNGYLAAVRIMKGKSVINEEVYSTLINMF